MKQLRIALWGSLTLLTATPVHALAEVTIQRVERAPRVGDFVGPQNRATGIAAQMTRVAGFVTRAPQDGVPMSENTEVYIGFDDAHLYAAFVCFDRIPGRVGAHLTNRDLILSGDDSVAFQVDAFRDLNHAMGFQSNALGVQTDGLYTEGKGWDLSFDTVWQSEGERTNEGYVVVMHIPLRSLRFPPGPTKTFGLMLYRGIPRTNEEGFWPGYSRRIAGRMNQAAVISGLAGAPLNRNQQLNPYTNTRSFRTLDPASEAAGQRRFETDDFDASVGVDAKVVLRESMSVDLTVNPDFSQVESDEPQVTVNRRFEAFYPEKRPFFLENASYFDTPIPLFFSRRVQDPDLGARLSGRVGSFAVGAVSARDRVSGKAFANVLRVSREVGSSAGLGVFGSTRSLGVDAFDRNTVGGLDGRLRRGAWAGQVQIAASHTSTRERGGNDRHGFAALGSVTRTGRSLNYNGMYSERSRDFESVLGYIDRVDLRRTDHSASYRWFPKASTLIDWGTDLSAFVVQDRRGNTLEHQVRPQVFFEWSRLTQVSVYRQQASLKLRRSEFALFDPREELSRAYPQSGWGFTATSQPTANVALSVAGSRLGVVNLVPPPGSPEGEGRDLSWNAQIDIRPSTRLGLVLTALETRLDDPVNGPILRNKILRARTQFQFTRALSVRAIVQYDALDVAPARTRLASSRRVNVDLLAAYRPTSGHRRLRGLQQQPRGSRTHDAQSLRSRDSPRGISERRTAGLHQVVVSAAKVGAWRRDIVRGCPCRRLQVRRASPFSGRKAMATPARFARYGPSRERGRPEAMPALRSRQRVCDGGRLERLLVRARHDRPHVARSRGGGRAWQGVHLRDVHHERSVPIEGGALVGSAPGVARDPVHRGMRDGCSNGAPESVPCGPSCLPRACALPRRVQECEEPWSRALPFIALGETLMWIRVESGGLPFRAGEAVPIPDSPDRSRSRSRRGPAAAPESRLPRPQLAG